jgi:UDP-N-acetyl-D-glucosamine dehydrogenase
MPRTRGRDAPRPRPPVPTTTCADATQKHIPLTTHSRTRRYAKDERALNNAGRPVKGSRIALLGVSYKPGVGDIRESPALKILTLLSALGAELRYHHPHVPTLPDHGLSSIPLEEALQDADLALIVTAHPGVDHDMVLKRARLVVDLHGITRGTRVENVVRL